MRWPPASQRGPVRPACSPTAGVLLALALAAAGCGDDGGTGRPCTDYVFKSALYDYELPDTVARGDTVGLVTTHLIGQNLCYQQDHTDVVREDMACTITVWSRYQNCGEPCEETAILTVRYWKNLVPAARGWYRVTFDAHVTVRDSVWVE